MQADFPRIIDSTIRKDLAGCYAKAYYGFFENLKPNKVNVHLYFGGCFAKGLEEFRKAFWQDKRSLEESYNIGLFEIIKAWGEVDIDHPTKSLSGALWAFDSYIQQYPPETEKIIPMMIDGKAAVEFTFALPIPNCFHPQDGQPILYAGRFDMLGEYRSSAYIVDEKTTGSLGDSWRKNFTLSSQMTGYSWCCREYGFKVGGIIIRGLGILKGSITHLQLVEQRSDWMIDRWLNQLSLDVNRAIEIWKRGEAGMEYNLDNECSAYGGCPYMDLCLSKNPHLLKSSYIVRGWNPLEKLGVA